MLRDKIIGLLMGCALVVLTLGAIGLSSSLWNSSPYQGIVREQLKCIPNCSENPKFFERDFNEASAEFKGGQPQAGGLKPIDLNPNQGVAIGLPSGTKQVVITAGEGDLTYRLTKVVGTGARAQRTKIADGVVAAKQSATVNVPPFDRTKQESMELSVTAGSKETSVSLVFQGAPADETVLPPLAVELGIANNGPAEVTYEVRDALNRLVKNAGQDVKGTVKAGEKAVVGIEESAVSYNRVLQISTKGDAKVDVKIYFEQIPKDTEIGRGIYATTLIARPRTLNPITATDGASMIIISHLHQKLLDGPVGAETGAIAEAFEVTPDRKTVTYTIRKGVKFSDGTLITSEDVRFTFENLIYPKDIATNIRDTLYCAGGKDLPTIKVIDERKISFTCDKPAARVPFPNTGFVAILSKKNILKLVPNVEWSPKDFNNALGVNTKPEDIVGAGPFRLSKLDPNAVAEFVRNPFYFYVDEKGNQLPYLGGVRLLLAPTQGQELALQQFRNGKTDSLSPRPADIAILQSDKAAGRLPINDNIDSGVPGNTVESLILSWTTKNPTLRAAFANKQVRFALSHAIDRASIVKNIYLGLGTEAYSPLNFNSPYHLERPGQKADVLAKWEQAKKRFDLKKAAEILDSLGIKDTNGDGIRDIPADFANDFGRQKNPPGPFKFELNTNVGNTLREEMIKQIASDLKKIGIEVTAVPKDFAALTDQLTVGDYEAILIGLPTGSEAASGINIYTSNGNLHFWNVNAGADHANTTADEQRLDALYRQLAEETDEAKLHQLADEAQFVFAGFLPYIPIVSGNFLLVTRTDTIRMGVMPYCKGGRCRGG
jgi:peptide/nickel transport system substrate-binding protein